MKTLKPVTIELLILLRKRKGWGQTECARRLGVSVRALRSWECAERTPKPIVFRTIKEFVTRNI